MLSRFYLLASILNKITLLLKLIALSAFGVLVAITVFGGLSHLPPIPFVLLLIWALLLHTIAVAFQNEPPHNNTATTWWQRVKQKITHAFLLTLAGSFCALIVITLWLTVRLLFIMNK